MVHVAVEERYTCYRSAHRGHPEIETNTLNILIFTEFERPRRNALLPGLFLSFSLFFIIGDLILDSNDQLRRIDGQPGNESSVQHRAHINVPGFLIEIRHVFGNYKVQQQHAHHGTVCT